MLAPIDKVTRRGGNDVIQVVITRKCNVHTCSNCTQLLPFRRDAKEMSLECVEEALLSLADWPGVVACFGGNPCNHSRFPEVAALWKKHVHPQRRRGLWTNDLLHHAEVVREVWHPDGRFNLNVHGDKEAAASMRRHVPGKPVYGEAGRVHHGAMMIDRKDFGVSDEEWVSLREKCPINRNWSGAIYQGADGRPYAYFCEVGGALDGVRGENNGVPAAPGWWRQPMEHFAHQVGACCDRGCGVPLEATGHQDADAVYDVSVSWAGVAEAQRVGKVSLNVLAERPPPVHELTDYVGLRLKGKG